MAVGATACLIFAAFAMECLCMPMRWLVAYVADDGFYYLQIARHIAATGQSSFDGISHTNGYHPGWMLLMTVCATLVHNPDMLLRCCLGVSLTLHLLTTAVLWRVFRRFVAEQWAWIGALGWMCNPLALRLEILGVETPLLLFAFALLVLEFCESFLPFCTGDRQFQPTGRQILRLSLLLSLCVYARTDQIALVSITMAFISWTAWRHRAPQSGVALLRRIAIMNGQVFLTVALCWLPWCLYSLHSVGAIVQDSGAMKWLWMETPDTNVPLVRVTNAICFLFAGALCRTLCGLAGSFNVSRLPEALALCVLLAVSIAGGTPSAARKNLFVLSQWLLIFCLAHDFTMGFVGADDQVWHTAETGLSLYAIIYLSVALALHGRIPNHRTLAAMGVTALFLAAPAARSFIPFEPNYLWQQDVYDSQPLFETLIPVGDRIGCFNAGIPGYFSPRTIVDIDGLVNHDAVLYWKMGRLNDYLRKEHIGYIADESTAMNRAELFSHDTIHTQYMGHTRLRDWSPPIRFLWKVGP